MKTTFDERYGKLNKAQKQAVDSIEGPLLVVAGPGSGKTEILSLRVANILRQTQVLPSNILCLTFTESASLNMRDRLSRLMGQEAYRVSIHTFHNFCVNIIQKYPEFFYGGALFTAADPIAQISILEGIFDSLPFNDPLRSVHPEQGYVYLSAVSRSIGSLKKAGLTPDEFLGIIEENSKEIEKINAILSPIFEEKLSKKSYESIEGAVNALAELAVTKHEEKEKKFEAQARGEDSPLQSSLLIHLLSEVVARSLEVALNAAREDESTKPLSVWKEKMMKRTDEGTRVFKDAVSEDKMRSLAALYKTYYETMHMKSLYDFDDMILDTIAAIETYPRLRYELQEQYQYILVDEFQDTNDAQMRLLRLIADAPVNEGRPNIMVVGDDDQAVYKFQGAELSNILDFKRLYVDVGLVTMTANYRSTQEILDVASYIIKKGENRLENILPEMEKTLIASHPDMAPKTSLKSGKKSEGDEKSGIVHRTFHSSLHEYHYVSREIKRLIDGGKAPADIAVIARKHRQLESLVPFLQGAGVPIRYEREQNVFKEPHIHQLITLARFISSLHRKEKIEADEFLPEILSYPFWNLQRRLIWDISATASRLHQTWLEAMIDHGDSRVRAIAQFLMELGVKAGHEPLEKMLDMMIGAHVVLAAESEDEDEEGDIKAFFRAPSSTVEIEGGSSKKPQDRSYTSPFKEYYFNKERFEHARAEYLSFLSSLRVFIRALREYNGRQTVIGDMLLLRDLIDFVDLHEKNNIALNDKSPFGSLGTAVNLLSAHKSKGLEFDTVFVLSCQDDVWAGRGMPNRLSFPSNLQVDPAGDTTDDQLRLFYVALTRAKHHLYLTSYEVRDDGEPSASLRFLLSDASGDTLHDDAVRALLVETLQDDIPLAPPEAHELLTASWLQYHTPPFLGEERALLESLLENYQLSVTHLNNFLNVVKGGPQVFLEQNLLRFPQAKTPSGSFGSAIHRALEKASIELRRTGDIPKSDDVLSWFSEYLRRERLSKIDQDIYEKRGREALSAFYESAQGSFNATDKTELNFKDQGVVIKGTSTIVASSGKQIDIHLTGKIDRVIDVGGGVFEVHDYKTGKAKETWVGKDQYEKIKLYEYRRQLVFYKILVEHSRDFSRTYRVNKGYLDFVEPLRMKSGGSDKKSRAPEMAHLSLDITSDDVSRIEALAAAVHKKIMNLDFPDVSRYSQDLEGITTFEDDLLSGKI